MKISLARRARPPGWGEAAAADEHLAAADLAAVGGHLDAFDREPVLTVVRGRLGPVDALNPDHQWARTVQVVLFGEVAHPSARRCHRHVLTLLTSSGFQ